MQLTIAIMFAAMMVLTNGRPRCSRGSLPRTTLNRAPRPRIRCRIRSFVLSRGQRSIGSGRCDRTGRADSSASHYWVAYTFDVRPGVAVDLDVRTYDGGVTRIDGASVQTNGKVETKNLGVFLLYERSSPTPDRVEIYNLDRKRGYDAYPVHWIGRATADETFALLRGLLDNQPSAWVAERAVMAIAVNADPRASDILEGIVTSSKIGRARTTAATWIGINGGHVAFLGDRIRDESEDTELRKQSAIAIGIGRDPSAISTLRALYESVGSRDVRDQLIVAAGIHGDEERVVDDDSVDFLIHVADTEKDTSLRRQAIFWLRKGRKAQPRRAGRQGDATVGGRRRDTEAGGLRTQSATEGRGRADPDESRQDASEPRSAQERHVLARTDRRRPRPSVLQGDSRALTAIHSLEWACGQQFSGCFAVSVRRTTSRTTARPIRSRGRQSSR